MSPEPSARESMLLLRGGHRLLPALMAGRENDVQRHQRLQRMRAGFGQGSDVLADEAALPDLDQFLGCLPLRAVQFVLVGNGLEAAEDSAAQLGAVTRLEQQLVE